MHPLTGMAGRTGLPQRTPLPTYPLLTDHCSLSDYRYASPDGDDQSHGNKQKGTGGVVAKKKPSVIRGLLWYWATTYSPTGQGSTIGAVGLNFSVRNGKRCAPTL